ncbi:MAG: hypothetical protein JOZ52_04790 [Acidobacteria bacterium]|nr:hypothetical protein [Acidobacteriota bacterium]
MSSNPSGAQSQQVETPSEPVEENPDLEVAEVPEFLDQWDVPHESADCLSEAELMALVKDEDHSRWPEHVNKCVRCRDFIGLLQSEKHADSLQKFLAMTAKEASEIRADRKHSFLNYVRALLPVNEPLKGSVYAGLMALLIIVGLWGYLQGRFAQPQPPTEVVFDKDDYKVQIEAMQAKIRELNSSEISAKERHQYIEDYNKHIAELKQLYNTNPPSDEYHAEVGKVLAVYKAELESLKSENKSAPKPPEIQTTPDAVTVALLFAHASDAVNGAPANLKETVPADDPVAVKSGAKEIDVVSIRETTDEKVVGVVDRVPTRNSKETEALKASMTQFAKQNNSYVVFTTGSTRVRIDPSGFAKSF